MIPSASQNTASNPPAGGEPPAAPAPAKRKYGTGLILLVLLLGALLIGFLPRWREHQTAVADMNQLAIPTVSVVSPGPGKSENGLVLPAEIQPWREASIYARANGYLKDWVADIGAHVQPDQLLAEIDTPDLDQQLEQAKAQLVLSQANLHLAEITDHRWQELLKSASVTEQAAAEKAAGRETAAASVAADEANMRRLQELVSFQRVTAPFAGTITIRAVDIGDLIVAGSGGRELFHLAQTDKLRVYVRVPESAALGIAPGQAASITTPENELEVDNSQHQILPNSFGEVTFQDNHSIPKLVLPSNTLLFRAQGLQVGVVRPDNTVELRSVRVGRDFGQTVEILEGVTPADHVITNPTDSLVNGLTVRVDNSPAEVAEK